MIQITSDMTKRMTFCTFPKPWSVAAYPNNIRYLMDFTFCETLEPEDGRRITEDSVHVRAFNFWRKHTGEEA